MKNPPNKRPLVRLAPAIEAAFENLTPAPPPPLERDEPPHRKLARATKLHGQLTQDLRVLKLEWARKNIESQQSRQAISTAEVTHVEKRRRELHFALEGAQRDIAAANKAIREMRAAGQGNGNGAREPAESKTCPFMQDPEFKDYFYVTACGTLTPSLLAQLIRDTKATMAEARKV